MNIYLICAVRNAGSQSISDAKAYVERLREAGATVHFPPEDAPQDCPTGERICAVHLEAMKKSDEVHVIWDVESKGSHFDLGMAYAMGKKIVPVNAVHPDTEGKSYWKVINAA